MNLQLLNLCLLTYLAFILFKTLTFDWSQTRLNRWLFLSFIFSIIATLLFKHGSYVDDFYWGLNYLHSYENSGILNYKSHISAAIAVLIAFGLLLVSSIPRNKRNIKAILFDSYFIIFIIFIVSIATAFPILLLTVSLLAWTGIPIAITGTIIIYKTYPSLLGANNRNRLIQLLICLTFIFHCSIPWLYPTWLETQYQKGFEGGLSEALENQMDIAAIHQWLSRQDCSKWVHNDPFLHQNKDGFTLTGDYQQGDESYQQLPLFIRQLNPIGVGLVSRSCDVQAVLILILYYRPGFGLAIISPHPNSTPVTDILYDFSEMPISDECNCYIIRKGWS